MSFRFELKLEGKAQSMFNLVNIDNKLKKTYLEQLYDSGVKIRDTAKLILRSKVNPEYSTGLLESSIKVAFNPNTPAVRVGPDMRMTDYAEWVELGHKMGGGWAAKSQWWWEGHHYMEESWLTHRDNIIPSIRIKLADELMHYTMEKNIKGGISIRHGTELVKGTGRFVGGSGRL